jgi:tight adherence protein C
MNSALKKFFGTLGENTRQRLGGVASGYVAKLDRQLIAAGEPGELKGIELFGMQVALAVFFPIFWGFVIYKIGFLSGLLEGPKQVLVYLALAAVGFMFPAMNIQERAKKRQRSISLQLPDTLDLLTISVEAGLDFMSAMRRVGEKHRPRPLKDELDPYFKQTQLGRPRREALRDIAKRVQLQDLSAVVSALIQADRLGVSIGPILRVQSDMMRTRRGQKAEKAAQEAPVKMLAPLMICILPSVFIMILAPVIIQMVMNMSR